MDVIGNILNQLKSWAGSQQTQFDFRSPERQQKEGPLFGPKVAQAATPSQAPSPSPMATTPTPMPQGKGPQPTPIAIARETLAKNISNTWGKDTPILQNLDLYMQGGNQLPGNMEKLLPIAMALRETQGGKDLINPNKNSKLGKNNVFNIRNDTGAFQDYPDLATAILGNLDKGGQSAGMVGLLRGDKPGNKYIYEDYRNSNQWGDLFKRWSPPTDSNGSLEEQQQNIEWILNQLKK